MMTKSLKRLKNKRMMKTNNGFTEMTIDQISVLIWSWMEYSKAGVIYQEIDNVDGESINEFINLLQIHKIFNQERLKYCKTLEDRIIQSEALQEAKQAMYEDFCDWLNKYFYNEFKAEDLQTIADQRIDDITNRESLAYLSFLIRKIAKKTGDSNLLKSSILKKYADEFAKVKE